MSGRHTTDRANLAFVVRWAAAGLAISVAATALALLPPMRDREPALVERALHHLDGRTCAEVLRAITDGPSAGARILWLWAEESTPGVYASATRLGPADGGPALPPRPYATRPPAPAPALACSFASNSLHIITVE